MVKCEPFCVTCGITTDGTKDDCEKCAQWWLDNPLPMECDFCCGNGQTFGNYIPDVLDGKRHEK